MKFYIHRLENIIFYLLAFTFGLFLSCKKHNEPISEYNKVYGGMKDDYGYAIATANDGGFVIAGTTSSNNGDVNGNHGYTDAWVVRTNTEGEILWNKTYGGSGYDSAFSIVSTSDGGFAVAGSTSSNDGDVSLNNGKIDVWIVKIDGTGKLIWQKTFGGPEIDGARAIVETSDGGLAIAGYTNNDAWILKVSGIGNLLWQQKPGSNGNDFANSIVATKDGGVVVAGQLGLLPDMFITRFRETGGSPVWQRTLGGSRDDVARSIVVTPDSGFVVAGNTYSQNGNIGGVYDTSGKTSDVCVAKVDGDSKIVWIKVFGGLGNDVANTVIATADGGFLVAGQTNSTNGDVTLSRGGVDAWVLKVDARGNKLWQQSVGGSGPDAGNALIEIPRKGYIMAGSSSSNDGDVLFNHGGYDAFIATFKNDY